MCIHNHTWVSKCHIDCLIGCDNVALEWCFGVKTINAFHCFKISIFSLEIKKVKIQATKSTDSKFEWRDSCPLWHRNEGNHDAEMLHFGRIQVLKCPNVSFMRQCCNGVVQCDAHLYKPRKSIRRTSGREYSRLNGTFTRYYVIKSIKWSLYVYSQSHTGIKMLH